MAEKFFEIYFEKIGETKFQKLYFLNFLIVLSEIFSGKFQKKNIGIRLILLSLRQPCGRARSALTLIPMAQIVHKCGLALAAKLCMLGSAQTIFRYNSTLGKASTIFLKIG